MSEIPSSLERAAARSLVEKYLRVRTGENVIVDSWSHTLSMAAALVDEARRVGGRALLTYENDDAWWRAVERKQARSLGGLSDPEWAAVKAADVYVTFWGPADSARLDRLPEATLDEWASGWFDRWYRTARSTGLRGGRMATGWVTDARVRHWGVRGEGWRKALLEACLADPRAMARSGERLARALRGARMIRITHPNGTDLEVAPAGVPPRIYDGIPHPRNKGYSPYDMMANFPDGSVRIALDGKTAEGTIVASHPSYDLAWFPWNRYLGGQFGFSGGRLSSFSFQEGQSEFAKRYARGTPGKDRTGYLVIGLNPRIQGVPYLEDRERGGVHLTVGGNAYLGGRNRSDFYGAISLSGAEIRVDGTLVARCGKLL